jgi:hypothetical protein
MVERTLIKPPNSRVGVLTHTERKAVINATVATIRKAESANPLKDHEALQNRILRLGSGQPLDG